MAEHAWNNRERGKLKTPMNRAIFVMTLFWRLMNPLVPLRCFISTLFAFKCQPISRLTPTRTLNSAWSSRRLGSLIGTCAVKWESSTASADQRSWLASSIATSLGTYASTIPSQSALWWSKSKSREGSREWSKNRKKCRHYKLSPSSWRVRW